MNRSIGEREVIEEVKDGDSTIVKKRQIVELIPQPFTQTDLDIFNDKKGILAGYPETF